VPENSVVITDTSCFVLLEKVNAFPILYSLFATIITTPEIAKEYGNALPVWVIIQKVNNKALQHEFNQYIDPGEASAIALASEITCEHLIVDDMAARKFAEKLGLPIKGTVGVLLMAKQKGVIPLLRPYLDLIQQTNFRLSQKLVEQFIKDADE
jgi:predicted nucleic acid-binding protein